MYKVNTIEKRLEYYELIMVNDNLNQVPVHELPRGFRFEFFNNNLKDWVTIHINSQEFTCVEYGEEVFKTFYDGFKDELSTRCIFIVDEKNNKKIATATISPCNEYGYTAKIDWFAIDKEYQGRSLSKPLLYYTLKHAQRLGYNRILLHTQTHTWVAVKLYLSMGFEPFDTLPNLKGWQIVKTLTKHPKLERFKPLPEGKMYHNISENIVAKLNLLHKNYFYEIWFKNGRNDVYVNDGVMHYEYKFFRNGKKLKLANKGTKRIKY